jgi:hypothetical protein
MDLSTVFWISLSTCLLGGLVFLLFQLDKAMKTRAAKAKRDLETQGYVKDTAYLKPHGDITRFWGRYSQSLDLYIQVSDLDPIQVTAGKFGIADLKLGHDKFDKKFVARSNDPHRLKIVINDEIKEALLSHTHIRFRTGSIDSLIGADYFRDQKSDRDLRNFWMFEKVGLHSEAENSRILKLGKAIAQRAEQFGLGSGVDNRTSFFEGR